ncbi:hypothetical protein BV375_35900, partial [Nostoc sp. 106C]
MPWEPAQRSGSKICLEKFAQIGKPFRQLLMGETPKTALPHHATPVALSRETRRQLLQRREPPLTGVGLLHRCECSSATR